MLGVPPRPFEARKLPAVLRAKGVVCGNLLPPWRSKPFPAVVAGTPGGSEGFTAAPGSESTGGHSGAPGTTLAGRAGMPSRELLLRHLGQAASG